MLRLSEKAQGTKLKDCTLVSKLNAMSSPSGADLLASAPSGLATVSKLN